MYRFVSDRLDAWLNSRKRKPLVIRGARQVGKTWLIRDLAKRKNLDLVECNFERSPGMADHFSSNNPQEIIRKIEADLNISINTEKSLLFLDEIQAKPELLASLRWFYEEMPQLPVVAAGSLLDFALEEHTFSMPVGRIEYCYLEPMSFLEFLRASGNESLYTLLQDVEVERPLNNKIHTKCLESYLEYMLIGGMPEVVSEWYESKNSESCIKVQQDLLATIRDDFNKYRNRIDTDLLSNILSSVSEQLGNRFIATRVKNASRTDEVKKALSLLQKARVCHRVSHTSGNGLPLGAESNEKIFKVLLLDVGLAAIQLGLSRLHIKEAKKIVFQNKGPLAEQFVGQQIRVFQSRFEDPSLFYWQRLGGRQGEIDYLIQQGTTIVPIEIKSGARGAMKSLHQFMYDKVLPLAVRIDQNLPSINTMNVKTTLGDEVSYFLLSIPLYLTEILPCLLDRVRST